MEFSSFKIMLIVDKIPLVLFVFSGPNFVNFSIQTRVAELFDTCFLVRIYAKFLKIQIFGQNRDRL